MLTTGPDAGAWERAKPAGSSSEIFNRALDISVPLGKAGICSLGKASFRRVPSILSVNDALGLNIAGLIVPLSGSPVVPSGKFKAFKNCGAAISEEP